MISESNTYTEWKSVVEEKDEIERKNKLHDLFQKNPKDLKSMVADIFVADEELSTSMAAYLFQRKKALSSYIKSESGWDWVRMKSIFMNLDELVEMTDSQIESSIPETEMSFISGLAPASESIRFLSSRILCLYVLSFRNN